MELFLKEQYYLDQPNTDDKSCRIPFMSLAEFEHAKTGNYALSKKIRNAVPLKITGWSQAADLGLRLPKVIEDGLILTGSAAGFIGTSGFRYCIRRLCWYGCCPSDT